MHFFIATGLLLTASTAFLLHQFWTRALSSDDAPPREVAPEAEAATELKAA